MYLAITVICAICFAILCVKIANTKQKVFDPYEILNIPESASSKEIKKAYNKLVLKYHPDKSHEKNAKDANGKQLGYFANLTNAKALCDKNPGSKVYDSNNNVIHSNIKTTLYTNLYPVRSSWNVYPTDKAPVSGNQCGSLNPLASFR